MENKRRCAACPQTAVNSLVTWIYQTNF